MKGISEFGGIGILIGVFVVFAIIALTWASFTVAVPAGNIGVVYDLFGGGVLEGEMNEGFHFKSPFQSVTMYSTRTQDYTMSIINEEGNKNNADEIRTVTKEGLYVDLDITVWYKIVPKEASVIHQTIGERYAEVVVRPAIRSSIREVVADYTAQEVYGDRRVAVQSDIFDKIDSLLKEKNIITDQVLLRNVILPPQVSNSIEEKLAEEQNALKMEFTLQKEQREAERKVIEAQGIADSQAIIDETLTTGYLKYLWLQKLSEHNSVIYVPIEDTAFPIFKDVDNLGA